MKAEEEILFLASLQYSCDKSVIHILETLQIYDEIK